MTLRNSGILCVLIVIQLVHSTSVKASEASKSPNVILIMTDDQGWGDIRSHGNEAIHTPVLDRLAKQGARFDRFYVCPVCAPTRAGLLTGRYHLRTGVHGVTRGYETMRAGESTIAELFKAAGYATGMFGKWHNGAHYPNHPNGQGFDEFVGFCAGHWNNYFNTTLERNGRPLGTRGYITDVLTNHTLKFINDHRKRPFFCYVAYNAPHSPFQVPDQYFNKYKKARLDDKTACAYGMVENIDNNIGRILARLKQLGLAENTIVVFLTDNGPNSNRYNGGMRGRKGSAHEGGVRVPCFIRWPGQIRAGQTIDRIASHIDLTPTLLDLAGVKAQPRAKWDGVSLAPLLRGDDGWVERMLFTHRARGGKVAMFPGAVRTQRHRAVRYKQKWMLFDMQKDPGEKNNIAAKHPELVAKLDNAYRAWFNDVTRSGFTPIPTRIGHPKARSTVELPAHEAFLKGAVSYSGRAGWANDWITNWKSKDATITWPVDVVEEGKYMVTLMYACPPENVGSSIRFSLGESRIEAVVRHAYNPEPLPSPDRVKRIEVYEKRWDRLMMGEILLKRGKQSLVLKAIRIPNGQVMQLKSVRVQRLP